MKYSKIQLQRAVRVERLELTQERIKLSRRLNTIADRLKELDKADDLLDGD